MVLESTIIEFKGMLLFQKARFKTPFSMDGAIQDFACFFYMVKGNMASYDARGVHHLGEKEAVIKNCGNYVQRYIPSQTSDECEAIAVYLYPKLLQEIYKDEIPSFLKEKTTKPPKKLIANQLIEQFMNNLFIYFENPDTIDEELGILKLKELMMLLLKSESHSNIRKLLSEIFAPVNVAFKQTIENQLYNVLSLEELAFICNMSLSTFKRVFQKEYNETPAKYIKNRRLEQAATLLVCSEESIGHIAFECGFQDVTTFSSNFQNKYGESPSKYRLNQIGK